MTKELIKLLIVLLLTLLAMVACGAKSRFDKNQCSVNKTRSGAHINCPDGTEVDVVYPTELPKMEEDQVEERVGCDVFKAVNTSSLIIECEDGDVTEIALPPKDLEGDEEQEQEQEEQVDNEDEEEEVEGDHTCRRFHKKKFHCIIEWLRKKKHSN